MEHAGTLLDYGGFLRRYGQPTRARRVLVQAIQVAEAAQVGWPGWLTPSSAWQAGGAARRHGN